MHVLRVLSSGHQALCLSGEELHLPLGVTTAVWGVWLVVTVAPLSSSCVQHHCRLDATCSILLLPGIVCRHLSSRDSSRRQLLGLTGACRAKFATHIIVYALHATVNVTVSAPALQDYKRT